jgi:hypothetical protein
MSNPMPPATSRRNLFTLGGAAVALGVVAAACGSSTNPDGLPVTGTLPTPSPDPTVVTGRQQDVTLLRTAQSIEALAAETYGKVLSGDAITTSALRQAARLIGERHEAHVGLVGDLVRTAGGTPHPQPNPYLQETVVAPALEALTSEEDVLALLLEVENLTSQTEIYANELLSTPELRAGIVAVGSAGARQVSVLLGLQGMPQVPFPLFPVSARAPQKAYLPE